MELVSQRAHKLLVKLGKDERTCELAEIAAYLHDIGNAVNRMHHGMFGAVLAKPLLMKIGMPFHEVHRIIGAIGNHNEGEGDIVSDICAALVLGDKSDVHETRVRASGDIIGDIHDKVNFAAKHSDLYVKEEGKVIGIDILIDPTQASVMEYFEIFLDRMKICKTAAEFLEAKFELVINGVRLEGT